MARRLELIDPKAPWTQAEARHLLNRAGFGLPVTVADRLAAMGPAAAVAAMVDYDRFTDNLEEPDWFLSREEAAEQRRQASGMSAEERQALFREQRRRQREDIERLKTWWLERMATTTRPLQEKMTLFWHGHFAVSAEKVIDPHYNYELNKVFRVNAVGNFRDLVFEVGKTPAMLDYLDNRQNRKDRPNENWARELMELFTLGIGNYTEKDIREAARAFSGYTLRDGQFTFVERNHDFGEKTFLGRTGNWDGADVINIIFEQPQAATFIAKKLWEYFVYENPDDALVAELGAVFREADYELKPLLRTMFLSKEFYSARARQGLIKSPAQYIVALQHHLGMETPRAALLTQAMRALGQDLFYPPNVKGWDGNRAWINSNTLLARYNIPVMLAMGRRPNLEPETRLDEMDGGGSMMSGGRLMVMQQQQDMSPPDRRAQMRERLDRARDRRAATTTERFTPQNNRRPASQVERAMVKFEPLFEKWHGSPVNTAVRGLADQLFGRPLDEQQYKALAAVLADKSPTEPLTSATARLNGPAFLQLALSMAEYQLC